MARPHTMRTGPRRAVLVLAVVLGILAMHHVAAAVPHDVAAAVPHDVAAAVPPPVAAGAHHTAPDAGAPDSDGGDHSGGQHMFAACLAVLTAGAALLLALALFGTITDTGAHRDRRRVVPVRFGRGPPYAPPTSIRLASLCLLRV